MMFIVIGGAGGLANAFVSNYALFCVCRFVAAMGILTATDPRGANKTVNISILPHLGHTGLFLVPFTTSVELVGTKMVTFWSNMSHAPFALGQFVVIMIAYAERDWRRFQVGNNRPMQHRQFHVSLQIYSSVPIFFLLLLYFVTPESPRWLIANERYREARAVVWKAAKINGKHVPEEALQIPGFPL